MVLKVYNTLTRKKEVFKPIKDSEVKVFVCGPTVYDFIHVGNAKTYTQFDMIVKYLRYKKYNVFYLQNITDIDDKIIKKANEEKMDDLNGWKAVRDLYEKAYFEDISSLGINSINTYARATNYMQEIVSQVKRLIEKGFAYKISDGYYFDLSKDKDYGKLAHRTALESEDAVTRIDENIEKRNKGDFCLWKFRKENEPYWDSELGQGRPGWHIEDTAITEKEFGPQYDLHGGAVDLIFPHHEAEIAQMESISGKKPLVRYWMHTAFLNFNKAKMGKSKGNFFVLREVLEKYDKSTLRYFFLSKHYRTPIDFSEEGLISAKNSVERINEFYSNLNNYKTNGAGIKANSLIEKTKKEFERAMDDDFETSTALAAVFNFIRSVNEGIDKGKISQSEKVMITHFFKTIDSIFGFLKSSEKIPNEILSLVKEREKARKDKNWKESDRLRDEISNKGYSMKDTADGAVVKKN